MPKKINFLICGLVALMGLTACNAGSGSSEDNPPDNPPVVDSKYQVSQEYWTNNITRGGYFGESSNLTMNMSMTSDMGVAERGMLANQNGNLHFSIQAEEEMELYVKPLTDSSYDVYFKDEAGKWAMYNFPATYMATLSESFVVFVNPWLFSDFTYNETTHAYEKASGKLEFEDGEVNLTDIAFKFEDNKLLSLTYKATDGRVNYDFSLTVSNWGSTVVTFPKVDDEPPVVEVVSIVLSETELNMKVGENKQLVATVYPADAEDKEVTWSSSSPVALVEKMGSDSSKINIKAEDEGEAIITASTSNGVTATCKVIITKDSQGGDKIPAERIEVSQSELNLKVGESVTLTATVYPENATNKKVHWSPDQKGVVDIVVSGEDDYQCVVTAIGVGSCNLTAIVTFGVDQIIPITVTSAGGGDTPVEASSITLNPTTKTMKVGESFELEATVLPENAADQEITWELGSVSIIETKRSEDNPNGKVIVTGKKAGSTYVKAYLTNNPKVNATCRIVVEADTPVVSPTSISLNETSLAMEVNETKELVATVLPADATNYTIRWSSSSNAVTVTADAADQTKAVVKAVSEGSATISATLSTGLVATCAITVSEEEEPFDPSVMSGVTLKYKAFYGPLDYGEEALTNDEVDALMGDVRLALFDGVQGDDGEVGVYEFEYYHETNPMESAYFGTYITENEYASGLIDRSYNFASEKFSFGRGISYRNIVCNYGNLDLAYITKANASMWQLDGFTVTPGMYLLSGYLMDADGRVSGKGYAVFEKLNDNPVHLDGVPENHEEEDISDVINDKMFVYQSYITDDPSFAGNSQYDKEQENATVSFFEDGTFEYHLYYEYTGYSAYEEEKVYRGEFTVDYSGDTDPVYGEDVYLIELSAKDVVKNGEVTPVRFTYFDFYYSVRDNAIYRYREDAYHYEADGNRTFTNILQEFALSDEKPHRYQLDDYDNWDEAAVAEALSACGYTDALPKLDGVKTFSIRDATEDSFVIYCAFVDETSATQAASDYSTVLGRTFTGINQYNPETGTTVYYLFSPSNEYKVEIKASNNYVFINVLSTVVVYPSAEINELLRTSGYTDTIPELLVDGASGYVLYGNTLNIYVNADQVEHSIESLIALLSTNNYKERTFSGTTYYLSPNKQIALAFGEQSEGFSVIIYDGVSFPEVEFPVNEIAAYLAGVTDTYPDLSYDGEAYYSYIGPDDQYLDAYITVGFAKYLTEDEYLNTFVPALKAALLEAGFVHYKSITVMSGSGATATYTDVYLSPNGQISIRLPKVGASSEWDEESSSYIVVYKGYALSFVNLVTNRVTASDDGLPHLDDIYVGGNYTFYYYVGDEFNFDGILYASYTNGGATKEVTPTTISTPDMSTEGTKNITITYTEDGVTKECIFTICVITPELVEYTYKNENDWNIFGDNAKFMIWAWGGEYGTGQWVEITSINEETKEFVFSLYENCDGFKIVRLNPDDMPQDMSVWGVTAWDQTGDLTPSFGDIGYVISFRFI